MKNNIRRAIRDEKKCLGADYFLKCSDGVLDRFKSYGPFLSSDVVMLYYPLWDEVDVRSLFSFSLLNHKRVILPTVKGDDIIPVEINVDTEWRRGDFGIMEPVASPYLGSIDFILVPGVAFDSDFNRLGRGKGYYDRFLAKYPDAFRLGICFAFQRVDSVPVESFDLPMNDVMFI